MNRIVSLALISSVLYMPKLSCENSRPIITIFIHGTVAPGAALFSPVAMFKKNLSGKTWCNQIVQKVRKDDRMQQDWPMLEEGMIEIDQNILHGYHQQNLTPELGKFSAYQKDVEPIFNIIGHSHGATIGLYTALGEIELNKCMRIQNLVLWGMPLQKQQADLLLHPMFENVYNFFSYGDKIQTHDYISTSSSGSYARLEDVVDSSRARHRYDVQLFVENDKKAVTHHAMWLFGKYDNALSMRSKRTRRSLQGAFELISPVCMAAYTPAFIKNLEMINRHSNPQGSFQHINLNLSCAEDRLIMQAKAYSYEIDNPKYVTQRAKSLWQPHAICSEMKKHSIILKSAVNTIFKK